MDSLRMVLRLNASSCILFGLLFLFFGDSVNQFIGNQIDWLMPIVGGVLVINGLHLLIASLRKKPICPEILYFVLGDFAWVIGTIVLVALGVVVTSGMGVAAALGVAVMVGAFGVWQVMGYRKSC